MTVSTITVTQVQYNTLKVLAQNIGLSTVKRGTPVTLTASEGALLTSAAAANSLTIPQLVDQLLTGLVIISDS